MSTCILSLSGHTQSVTCIRWGGRDLIYSSSQDRTIKVWRREDVIFVLIFCIDLLSLSLRKKGVMCRSLDGHGHWVNTLALNSDYIIRTGAFDPKDATLVKTESTLSSH